MANNAKENFNQAMFSMFGVGKDPDAAKVAPGAEQTIPASVETTVPEITVEKEDVPVTKPAKALTYIAEGTVFEGNLKSTGDVEVVGTLKGNINADGQVIVHSALTGNITSESLQVISCTITGDIHVSGKLVLDKESCIAGNVFAEEFCCAGQVKGDLNVNGTLSLKESAKVEGNIVAGGMEMTAGAVLCGTVEMGGGKKGK